MFLAAGRTYDCGPNDPDSLVMGGRCDKFPVQRNTWAKDLTWAKDFPKKEAISKQHCENLGCVSPLLYMPLAIGGVVGALVAGKRGALVGAVVSETVVWGWLYAVARDISKDATLWELFKGSVG